MQRSDLAHVVVTHWPCLQHPCQGLHLMGVVQTCKCSAQQLRQCCVPCMHMNNGTGSHVPYCST